MISWMVALFIGGALLVLLEFILPGLICGIVGSIMMLTSVGLGVYAYPDNSGAIVFGGAVLAVVIFILGMWLMPRLGAASGLMQAKQQLPEEGYLNVPERTDLLHREAVVYSALRPAGVITIGNERLDAVSDAAFIDKDVRVRVIAVEGNRIVVETI